MPSSLILLGNHFREISLPSEVFMWPMRILYTFNNDTQTITIRAVGQRGDVYKN